MPRILLTTLVALLAWAIWCVLTVTVFVPAIRHHLLFTAWVLAYLLCLAPVVILGIVAAVRLSAAARAS